MHILTRMNVQNSFICVSQIVCQYGEWTVYSSELSLIKKPVKQNIGSSEVLRGKVQSSQTFILRGHYNSDYLYVYPKCNGMLVEIVQFYSKIIEQLINNVFNVQNGSAGLVF